LIRLPFPPRFPSLAAFGRRPLGARGSISIGPASETRHTSGLMRRNKIERFWIA
jgi:hypothetical protein